MDILPNQVIFSEGLSDYRYALPCGLRWSSRTETTESREAPLPGRFGS